MSITEVICPSEIQAELKRIWDSFEGANKTHASLFNLIFFTKKTPRVDYLKVVSQNVIEKFPSRVIFIIEDPNSSENYLNTRVNVFSSSKGESNITCDFIQFDVAGKFRERIPFVILPHLLPDLPIYVIWAEDPSQSSPLFTQLQQLATRMIFDSESIDHLPLFAKTLIDLEENFQFDIADLNWARIESWRELLASTFHSQERLAILKQCTKIQILYNAQASVLSRHLHLQAIYLQGWLATQLEWTFLTIEKQENKIILNYQREGGDVEVILYSEFHPTLKSGTILSVDLETADDCHFSFGRNLEMAHRVSMRFSTLEKCDIPLQYLFGKDESGQSLVKEICHKGTSHHYLHLLKRIKDQKELSFGENR